ncbi:MAG TPA: phosphodiester glycosidase family protein, partial [Clostridia bacterium]|nr:phosphodiester glycosidase family protein [Clostridia bacterium]
MNRFRKVVIPMVLSVVVITLSTITGFANQIVYEKIEDEIVSDGVTYKNVLRFTKDGWLNMDVVYFDLNNKNTALKLLQSAEGLSTRDTLSSMTEKEDDVVVSMNADFFFMQTPSSPTGAMIRDGEMVSSPVIGEELATFYIDNFNQASVGYWDYDIYVTTDRGNKIQLGSINKYLWEYRNIMLIDRNWGTHSPGATEKYWDMVEVAVENDEVVEVRSGQPAVEIPENGYILLASAAKAYELYDNLQVGDIVTVHTDITPGIDNIKLAFGGGTILVKDGQVAPFTQDVSGAHPRTAIGITQDRSGLIFVTIDGRHTSYKGVDGGRLAEILIELGSYEAIMMDGGGSTVMMKRGQGEFEPKIINHPSDGIERKIINSVAIVSTSYSDSLKGIKVKTDSERNFVGVPCKIDVKAFDKNYNPLTVNYSRVNLWLESGEGKFSGMNFIPTKSGKVIIGAEYSGIISEVTLDVLPSDDSQGGTEDSLNKPYEIEGEKLFIHSGIGFKNCTLLDRIVTNRIGSLINNNYDLSLFTGNVDSRLGDSIKKQMISAGPGHSSIEQGDSLIIQLDNSKDGIRQTDFEQWPWLQKLVNTTDKKNIFVVMSKPIFGNGG